MTNSTPEIPGYQFDQRILLHPLAELWHGRTFTGTDVIALILSEEGARNPTVVDRLTKASRDAALEPGRQETPLWAANFTSSRPYAITQLTYGETGAERLVDPLDGVLGNDDESLQAVRNQLVGYGATPPILPPGAVPQQDGPSQGSPSQGGPSQGGRHKAASRRTSTGPGRRHRNEGKKSSRSRRSRSPGSTAARSAPGSTRSSRSSC